MLVVWDYDVVMSHNSELQTTLGHRTMSEIRALRDEILSVV